MLAKYNYRTFLMVLVGGMCLSSTVAWAYDPQTKPSDNSGRQIAVVVPGMPHPAPIQLPSAPGTETKAAVGLGSSHGAVIEIAGYKLQLPTLDTSQISPQNREALEKGAFVAEGWFHFGYERLSDFISWTSAFFHSLTEAPRMTPASDIGTTVRMNPIEMRPIEDPGRGTQLIYTSEHRLRTVVGR